MQIEVHEDTKGSVLDTGQILINLHHWFSQVPVLHPIFEPCPNLRNIGAADSSEIPANLRVRKRRVLPDIDQQRLVSALKQVIRSLSFDVEIGGLGEANDCVFRSPLRSQRREVVKSETRNRIMTSIVRKKDEVVLEAGGCNNGIRNVQNDTSLALFPHEPGPFLCDGPIDGIHLQCI